MYGKKGEDGSFLSSLSSHNDLSSLKPGLAIGSEGIISLHLIDFLALKITREDVNGLIKPDSRRSLKSRFICHVVER